MKDEQQFEEEEVSEEGGGFKAWLEDNLRIILSVLVVFAIAGGIYSYSQRSQAPAITEETETEESIESGEEIAQNDEKEATATEESEEKEASDAKTLPKEDAADKDSRDEVATKPETPGAITREAESRETADSFTETAVRGDGATHLARRALENHLEKNPDSTLSREHKVYIEDYLRKHVRYGHVRVGTSLEFSKSLIQEAIGKSKQLNDRQLENLKKYSERASIR